jgi:hypothetical protein
MRGASGTSGGSGQFLLGFIMMCGSFYMLLDSIRVTSAFGTGQRLYGFSAMGGTCGVTSGMVMIPFMFGIAIVFYNRRNPIGWMLTVGSIVALIFGVISSIRFTFEAMSAFDLIVILVLAMGGLGLFLNSLRAFDRAVAPD